MPIGRQKTSASSSSIAIPRVFVHHAVLFGSEAILFFVVSIVATAASVFILSEKMHHNPFKLGNPMFLSNILKENRVYYIVCLMMLSTLGG